MNRTLARRRHLEANPINATQVALIGVGVIGGAAIVSAITRSSSATVSVLAAAGIIAIAYNAGKRKRNPIEETTQTYQVLLGNQSRVEHALEALSKRAKRKGLSPVTWSWGKAYVVEKERVPHPEYGYKVEYTADVARIPLTIVGGNPHYEGWTFIAVLEHLDGENIVRVLPGHELPKQYRECSPVCGHCNFNRKRNDTYVLRHDDGKYIQVGSTCIKDFLGSDDAGKVASAASYIADVRDIAEGGEEGYGEGGGSNASALLQYLPYVAYVVRKDGWVSKTAAREKGGLATASVAARYLYDKEARRKDNVQLEAQDELMAESAEAWAENLSDAAIDAETGDYLHNLRVIARSGVVTPRSEGLAASMVIAYQRAIGRERERAERAARPTLDAYVGTVGKREVFHNVTLDFVTGYETQYGYTTILKFRTVEGATLVWKASSTTLTRQDVGKRYQLIGTVKAHSEYNGAKQTIVSRCDVDNFEEALKWLAEPALIPENAVERYIAVDKNGTMRRDAGKKPKKTDTVLATGLNGVVTITPAGEAAAAKENPLSGNQMVAGATVLVGIAAILYAVRKVA
jgi:hypothetical protein